MIKKTRTPATPKVRVSDLNIRKAAQRVLNGQRLVSTEIEYVQRTLGNSATEQEIDGCVVAVRQLPWASIVVPE